MFYFHLQGSSWKILSRAIICDLHFWNTLLSNDCSAENRMQKAKSIPREIRQEAVRRNRGEMMALARIIMREVVRSMQVWDTLCRYRQQDVWIHDGMNTGYVGSSGLKAASSVLPQGGLGGAGGGYCCHSVILGLRSPCDVHKEIWGRLGSYMSRVKERGGAGCTLLGVLCMSVVFEAKWVMRSFRVVTLKMLSPDL